MPPRELFVVAAPGLETIVDGEIAALLPGRPRRRLHGGVEVEADDHDLIRLGLHLRAATRILARIARVRASSFSALHRRAARIPWESYLAPGLPLRIRASASRSRLYHTGGIAERVAKGIAERVAWSPLLVDEGLRETRDEGETETEAEELTAAAPQELFVRIHRDLCTVSVDASGPLHRRGYRLATAKAPLRENLAAAVLLAAGYRGEAFVDPMCGAGTLAIEAALLAAGLAPGQGRALPCAHWPSFDAAARTAAEAVLAPRAPVTPPASPLVASDRDPGAITASRANAARAGVDPWLRFEVAEFTAQRPPAPEGLVAVNPPYGLRIAGDPRPGGRPEKTSSRHLRPLYARLGAHLQQHFAGPGLAWRLALLAPTPALAAATGLPLEPRLNLRHGGLAVTLWVGAIVPEGSSAT